MYTLEVIAFNIDDCKIIEAAGAHRIELCDNPADGGTTPSYGMIEAARKNTTIHLFPIIRPRGGDFFYSDEEFNIMLRDIEICKNLGCDGVVTGMLKRDGTIPKKEVSKLVAKAYPLSVTFHRAFDRAANPQQAIADIIETGCERILTSGGFPTAEAGAAQIASWIQAFGNAISFMPGSGIRSHNLTALIQKTGALEYHSSARRLVASNMEYQNPNMSENMGFYRTDSNEISSMLQRLKENI